MSKFILPVTLVVIFLYSLSNWLGVVSTGNIVYNLLILANFACLLSLIIASVYALLVQRNGEKKVSGGEEEDEWQLSIERTAYNALIWIQVAFSISFVAFHVAFMLVRDTYPKVALYALILFIGSFLGWVLNTYLIRYIHPEFKLPDPKSPTYQLELFDSYDDGEKHLMLKALYKLYYWMNGLLILLGMGLMYYSILSGQSQLISIIGIGFILLFIQTYYTLSLKPKKIVL